ncbi:helix-turn-helix domain-containing protein [Amycolatopsis sp. WGS_07]|uniref:helix-turn-helix domain-containing protein n=1 Tax=Amycolatopsis sp. WGS_07 TaxID=3076764 RepID=UPI003873BA45
MTPPAVNLKGHQVTGPARTAMAKALKKKYKKGASIRALAKEYSRSYGFVRQVLKESGVCMRSRGGQVHTVSPAKSRGGTPRNVTGRPL